jgi:HlyD family secretion protein
MLDTLKTNLKNFGLYLRNHKIIVVILIILIGGGGYVWYQQKAKAIQTQPRYVLSTAEKGTLIASITGTGQVQASSSVSITSQASGKIISLKVKINQSVKTGDILAILDQRGVVRSLEQAQATLASAQANYNKVIGGKTPDDLQSYRSAIDNATLSLQQTEQDASSSIANAQAAVRIAQNNLKQALGGDDSEIVTTAYQNALITIQAVPAKLDNLLTQADNILGIDNNLANTNIRPFFSAANPGLLYTSSVDYLQAKSSRDQARIFIQSLSKASPESDIDKGLDIAEKAFTSMNTLLTNVSDVLNASPPVGLLTQSTLDGLKSTTQGNRGTVTSELSTIVNQRQSIVTARQSLANYQIAYDKAQQDLLNTEQNVNNAIKMKQLSLNQASDTLSIQSKPPLATDIASARAQVTSALAQLHAAQDSYADTIVKAPFDGVIAQLPAHLGDTIGASTALATLITQQKLAQISLNEVDVAKLKVGQKVTLTFDAIDELTISGAVSQIDTLGTVTQGVVNYNVQIAFDTQDDRIKPGMSVSAAIVINSNADVLLVPNSAVKTFGTQAYVEVVNPSETTTSTLNGGVTLKTPPKQQLVETGLSNDTMTEVSSGLNEGDVVVTQTITSQTATTNRAGNAAAGGNTLFRIPGAGGGTGGGIVRFGGGATAGGGR